MFWAAFFFAFLAQHSFVTYPLSLFLLSKIKPASAVIPLGHVASPVAILMCVRNEAKVLPDKIDQLRKLKMQIGAEVGLYIYNDASTDATADILSVYEEDIVVVNGVERAGKTAGLHTLLQKVHEPLVIITDATASLSVTDIERARAVLSDDTVGAVAGEIVVTNGEESASAQVTGAFWKLQHFTKVLENATGSVVGIGGAFLAFKKELYVEIPDDIMDDLHTSLSVLAQGKRAVVDENIRIHKRVAAVGQEEFNRKVRIACRQVNVLRHMGWLKIQRMGAVNIYKLTSRFVLRWLTLVWVALAALFGLLWFAALGMLDVGLILLFCSAFTIYFGAIRGWPVCPQLAEMFFMLYAVLLGVSKSFNGERFQTWEGAKSIRRT